MGLPMASNLSRVHNVTVFDSNPSARLQSESMQHASTVADLCKEKLDVVVTMLPSGSIVKSLLQNDLFKMNKAPTLFIDCSTIEPDVARALHKSAAEYQHVFIDAPVSGGVNGAKASTLTFMVGYQESMLPAHAEATLKAMGSRIFMCGAPGAGQSAKICNNLMLAISMAGLSECLSLGKALGLSPSALLSIINSSSGRCWSSEVYSPVPGTLSSAPSNNDYNGGFSTSLMCKDLNLAMTSSQTAKKLPISTITAELYSKLKTKHPTKDFSIIFKDLSEALSKESNK